MNSHSSCLPFFYLTNCRRLLPMQTMFFSWSRPWCSNYTCSICDNTPLVVCKSGKKKKKLLLRLHVNPSLKCNAEQEPGHYYKIFITAFGIRPVWYFITLRIKFESRATTPILINSILFPYPNRLPASLPVSECCLQVPVVFPMQSRCCGYHHMWPWSGGRQ